MVEEIARHLRGLGFATSVVCGAEARAALLTRHVPLSMPTIHVVCVQGNLQKRVVEPLREALARRTTGDEHLFIALLDISSPLTMVGQIRRFAEAFERTPAPPMRVKERRRWREHFGQRELAESPTKNYPIVPREEASQQQTLATERPTITGSHAIARATGPRTIVRATQTARARTILRGQTGKLHRATAPQAIIEGDRPRARARHRIGAIAEKDEPRTNTIVTPTIVMPEPVAPAVAPPRDALSELADLSASTSSDTITDGTVHAGSQTMSATILPDELPARRTGVVWVGALALGVAGAIFAWRSQVPIATPPAIEAASDIERAIDPATADEPAAAGPANGSPDPARGSGDPAPAPAPDRGDEPDEPAASADALAEHDDHERASGPSPHVALRDAIAQRRVILTKEFYVTRRRGTATAWYDARARCHELEIDGVDGWRLPWRRELKSIALATDLKSGTWWTYSSVDADRARAFAYDASTRQLFPMPKQDATPDVLCVKRRDR